jgi:hypothetical protein
MRFILPGGQLADFAFNPLKRRLKTLQMFQHQIFDILCHMTILRSLSHLCYNFFRRVAEVIS